VRAPALVLAAVATLVAGTRARAGEGAPPYVVVPVERGGTVRGICTVSAEVTPPPLPPWPAMGNDREIPSDRVRTGPDRRLGGCVVRIAKVAAGKDWPEAMRAKERVAWVELDGGRFVPHVQWARAGTQLAFRSRLPGDSNVHGYRDSTARTQFNFALGAGVERADVGDAFLEGPALYLLRIDSARGDAFRAYVHVVENPYCDVTSHEASKDRKAGEFLLSDVPPGEHEVLAWHERFEPDLDALRSPARPMGPVDVVLRKTVKVVAGETTFADFEFVVAPGEAR
jgi:hypothetical protein